jgi:hypothetical protein
MQRLPLVIFKRIALWVGDVAPELGPLAETCRLMSRHVRQCYCRHCGTVTESGCILDRKTGRVAHPQTCTLASKLDPFAFLYQALLESGVKQYGGVMIAGGWPAFLHFREHRRYDMCWRAGGEIRARDLDVFYYGNQRAPKQAVHGLLHKDGLPHVWAVSPDVSVNVLEILETPSKWNDKLRRMDTNDEECTVKLLLSSTATPGIRIAVDFINMGKCNCLDDVLASFDLPCARVGCFEKWYGDPIGSVRWVFGAGHSDRQQIQHALSDDRADENVRMGRSNKRPRTQYEQRDAAEALRCEQRRLKYVERGYRELTCTCRPSSSAPNDAPNDCKKAWALNDAPCEEEV